MKERWTACKWTNIFLPVTEYKTYDHTQDIRNLNTLLLNYGLKVDSYIDSPTLTTYYVNLEVDSKINTILRLEKNFQIACNDNNTRIYLDGNKLCIEKKGADNIVCMRKAVPDGFIGQERMLMCLGVDNTGKKTVYDLNKAPHMLVAGTTGSGKSIFLHQVITTLLINHWHDTVFIGIDPKGTEFSKYYGLKCFKPVDNTKQAIQTLKELCAIMDYRYKTMQAAGVRDIDAYNKINSMPRVVCVIDEFADLMMTSGDEVEDYVVRLAQKARAAGIHLIIATQRPTADVLTGLIKANIPTRVALKVVSQIDSRIILDRKGAEKLNGHGDMLFLPNGAYEPIRIQGAYVDDIEIEAIATKTYIEEGGDFSKVRKVNIS